MEARHLERFLASLPTLDVKPLVVLDLPVADIYGAHWSVTGQEVPDEDSPDEAVYLPGRNLLLLAKASVWCALNGIPTIAVGTLAANPFPDADREFFEGLLEHWPPARSAVRHRGGHSVQPVRPSVRSSRSGRQASHLISHSPASPPRSDRHCGRCNKCAERQLTFSQPGHPVDT